jgi:hypothetical protein
MAKSITEIYDDLKAAYIQNGAMQTLYGFDGAQIGSDPKGFFDANFSPVSIEATLLYIVAVATTTCYSAFEWLKEDVLHIVEHERYGYAGWYEKMAKLFRYGEGISDDYSASGSFAETDIYAEDPQNVEELQVVKHAFASDNSSGSGVDLKVAAQTNEEMCILSQAQLTAFTSYMNRIKPAGIPLYIVNEPAEMLVLNIKVWVNPLIFNVSGERIIDGDKPVEVAIKDYLKSIEFNGEFIVMKLIDFIQKVDGVSVVDLVSANVVAATGTVKVDARYTPHSGYLALADDIIIQYIMEG